MAISDTTSSDPFSPAALVTRAEALRPSLLEAQAATEARTFYSEATHQAFKGAGFYRMLVPHRYGGLELDATTFYRVMMAIARGCPSSGWMLCLGAAHALHAASYFCERAQDELLGEEDCFIAAASFAYENARAIPVDGGYRVSGTWHFCSGVPYASHHLGLVPTTSENISVEDLLFVVVPKAEFQRLDNWGDLIGLKGSGSHSVVVEDKFVPAYRTIRFLDMEDPSGQTIGYQLHNNPLYAGRFFGFAIGELAAVQVGAAQAAVDEFERLLMGKKTMSITNSGTPKIEDPNFQRCFGLAMAAADSAYSLMLQVGEQYMTYAKQAAAKEHPFSEERVWRLYGQQMTAARLSWEAGETAFRSGSTTGARDGARLQRYWRDLCAFRTNGLHQHDFRAGALAQARFGLPVSFF
ncbi:MAG: 3-hydroxy-9,10-secoandrosta-1,3,5(10)-triene-9,17-dione monooxygenase [Gammaproteobacteria bacterium]|jgi:3-hydroxy-9,10-secoandrosta-1,3,5(10)-triene-9,17-dione monooxygenase